MSSDYSSYLTVSPAFKAAYPDAHAGLLILDNVINPAQHAGLEGQKEALQEELRRHYGGGDRKALAELPAIRAYNAYYKPFKKTYHVLLQLESIVFKGKSIPSVAALVEAMFMAEVKNQLLTAGHDLDILQLPLRLDAAEGSETFTMMRGEEQTLKAGDMYIADREGIISVVLHGPDRRTQIRPETQRVAFCVYAPAGITPEMVQDHLEDIRSNVLLVSPEAKTLCLAVIGD